jgi:hypothetical protein
VIRVVGDAVGEVTGRGPRDDVVGCAVDCHQLVVAGGGCVHATPIRGQGNAVNAGDARDDRGDVEGVEVYDVESRVAEVSDVELAAVRVDACVVKARRSPRERNVSDERQRDTASPPRIGHGLGDAQGRTRGDHGEQQHREAASPKGHR